MAKVFISYKRDVSPDDELGTRIYELVEKLGHQPFIDRVIPPGTEWAARLEEEVAKSDWLVLLLSASSVESEMVRAEVELARRLKAAKGKPRILPVRVSHRDPLPYPLSAYLDGIQWAYWDGDATTAALTEQIRLALDGKDLPLPAVDLRATAAGSGAPLASAQPAGGVRRLGGSTFVESPDGTTAGKLYIERDEDRTALGAFADGAATTLTLTGPRQMGKTSLLNRLMGAARSKGHRVVYVDFKLFDAAALRDGKMLADQFCTGLALELDLAEPPLPAAMAKLSMAQSTTWRVKQLLKRIPERVLLAADELDRLFNKPVRNDFLGMLRSWHEARDNTPELKRLDMVLVSATEPERFAPDDPAFRSPFNVGTVVPLADFSPAQIDLLIDGHQLTFDAASRVRLIELFAGHPYLTRKALYLIAKDKLDFGPTTTAAALADPSGPFGDHLRQYLVQLQGAPELLQELRAAMKGTACSREPAFDRLRGAGLLRGTHLHPAPRCALYEAYFGERLDG